MSRRVRYAGPRRIPVTDGHEAEAKAAQLRKGPNRIGLFFLRVLGFRGEVTPPTGQEGHAGPSHNHPVPHEHPVPSHTSTPGHTSHRTGHTSTKPLARNKHEEAIAIAPNATAQRIRFRRTIRLSSPKSGSLALGWPIQLSSSSVNGTGCRFTVANAESFDGSARNAVGLFGPSVRPTPNG